MLRELAGLVRWLDLPEPQHDPDEVRRRADEILSRRQYQWDDESSNPLERVAEWISEQLSRLTGSFGGGGTGDVPRSVPRRVPQGW